MYFVDTFNRCRMINHRWWITLQMMAQTGGVLYRSCWLLPNSTGGLGRDVLQLQVTGGISLRKGSCEWREGAFAVAWDAGMVGVVWKSGGYDCDEPELGGSGRRWWMCSFGADIQVRWEHFSSSWVSGSGGKRHILLFFLRLWYPGFVLTKLLDMQSRHNLNIASSVHFTKVEYGMRNLTVLIHYSITIIACPTPWYCL